MTHLTMLDLEKEQLVIEAESKWAPQVWQSSPETIISYLGWVIYYDS